MEALEIDLQFHSFQEFLECTKLPDKRTQYLRSQNFAKYMDERDPLRHLRSEFYYPKSSTLPKTNLSLLNDVDEESVYFGGNSLGLLPKPTEKLLTFHMRKWAETGVFGHFSAPQAWEPFITDRCLKDLLPLVGAESIEEPTPERHKILLESMAFPSDHYAIESQIRLNGYEPETSMICLKPRENCIITNSLMVNMFLGEETLRTEDILRTIEEHGNEIAVVFFSSIQYYTGQYFEMEKITRAAQAKGCIVGWDCAHSFGNVPLQLHKWNVDFACWCTYKYGCTGAGGIGGVFVHSRYAKKFERKRLQGWWGHKPSTRFQMNNIMEVDNGVSGFQVSCTPFMLSVSMAGSLEVFKKTTIVELRQKSVLLTGYLEFLINSHLNVANVTNGVCAKIITPQDPAQRGCQLSLKFNCDVQPIFNELVKRGIAADIRHPNVIRVAPIHLYNSFDDCWRFVDRLLKSIEVVNCNNSEQ